MYPTSARFKQINIDKHMIATAPPLLMACYNNNFEHIKFLILTGKFNTEKLVSLGNYEDQDNITFFTVQTNYYQLTYDPLFDVYAPVLWHACRSFSISIVKTLIEYGANVNGRSDSRLNATPLM